MALKPKIAARGVWSKSDSRADTLHNRHHREDREMSGDPGAPRVLLGKNAATPARDRQVWNSAARSRPSPRCARPLCTCHHSLTRTARNRLRSGHLPQDPQVRLVPHGYASFARDMPAVR